MAGGAQTPAKASGANFGKCDAQCLAALEFDLLTVLVFAYFDDITHGIARNVRDYPPNYFTVLLNVCGISQRAAFDTVVPSHGINLRGFLNENVESSWSIGVVRVVVFARDGASGAGADR